MSAHTPLDERLVSLDAFRGFTIAGMVLVNNPGEWGKLYSQLAHAQWHGWTFTDWIFPFFLFICGVSMAFSLARKQQPVVASPQAQRALVLSLTRRAAIIFAIGLFLNLFPFFDFSTVRIPGVLQRIALCIAIAAPLVVYFGWRAQVGWILLFFALYSLMMLTIPVPDMTGRVAAGALEPGRDFGAYVDRMLMSGHLWAKVKTWDPEGIVSTLPAVGTLLFGVLTGRWLGSSHGKAEKTVWMLIFGLALLWLGAILDAVFMPINKSLWTVSYSVFMAGWALLVFPVFYWLIDGNDSAALRSHARRWAMPMTVYGMNALFIFAFSGIVARLLGVIKWTAEDGKVMTLKAFLYAPIKALPIGPYNTSLIYAIVFNLLMLAIAWYMYRRQWFIKV
jgi:predicted acyltransferase